MGYTTRPAPDMIGLGVSAIGDVAGAFAQNTKKLSTYYQAIDAGRFPVERGYALDADDHAAPPRGHAADVQPAARHARGGAALRHRLRRVLRARATRTGRGPDGRTASCATRTGVLRVTPQGRLFVRNICMIFDRHLREKRAATPVFSRTV